MSDDEFWDYSNFLIFIARCRIFWGNWLAPVFFWVLQMLRSIGCIVISYIASLIFTPYGGIQRLVTIEAALDPQMLAHLSAQLCLGCVQNIIKLHFCRKTLRTNAKQLLQLQKWFVLYPFILKLVDLLFQRTIVFILNSFGFMLLVDNPDRISFWLWISDLWSNIFYKLL